MNSKPKSLPVFNSNKELARFLENNLAETLKQAIRMTVNVMIREEMDQFRKEVNENLSFNGSYMRQMTSPVGRVANVPVPRFRQTPSTPMQLSSARIFSSEQQRFFDIVAEMHRLGVSQRKVRKIAWQCFGIKMSAGHVGEVHRELAEQECLQINSISLEDEFEYLLLDGLWVKCKSFGLRDNNNAALLCALGIKADGTRKVIGFQIAFKEDEESWKKFVTSLKQRGLIGKHLKLIISDDQAALTAAADQVYPSVPVQICIAHKMRNVIQKTSYQNRSSVAEDLKIIYRSENKELATGCMKLFVKKWYVKEEKATKSIQYDFERTLTYLDFPRAIWSKIRTTNILEREFREVRRRIKVFDNSFNDENSLSRYAHTTFDYLNNNYPAALHSKT